MSSVVAPSRSSRFCTAFKTAIRTATRTRALSGLDFGFRTNIPMMQGEHHTNKENITPTGTCGWLVQATGVGAQGVGWRASMPM